uniref:Uncharacterized protein n=1 Tax=Leersia perrieri TaxID=77586 RepID=A0A0D9XPT5_9ORYZ
MAGKEAAQVSTAAWSWTALASAQGRTTTSPGAAQGLSRANLDEVEMGEETPVLDDAEMKEDSVSDSGCCYVFCTLVYVPLRNVIEDMSIQANVPALAMEETAPVAVSDAAMLAPEEILKEKVMLQSLHKLSAKEEELTRKGDMQRIINGVLREGRRERRGAGRRERRGRFATPEPSSLVRPPPPGKEQFRIRSNASRLPQRDHPQAQRCQTDMYFPTMTSLRWRMSKVHFML